MGDIIYIAGQIALIPGSMTLINGGARMECRLALRHLTRILKAVDPKVEIRDIVQVCKLTLISKQVKIYLALLVFMGFFGILYILGNLFCD